MALYLHTSDQERLLTSYQLTKPSFPTYYSCFEIRELEMKNHKFQWTRLVESGLSGVRAGIDQRLCAFSCRQSIAYRRTWRNEPGHAVTEVNRVSLELAVSSNRG